MIYQFGKKRCSNSGRKRNDIFPRKVILLSNPPPLWNFLGVCPPPPHPPGISNSLRGGGLDIFWNHTFQNSNLLTEDTNSYMVLKALAVIGV